jgi:long-chain fatty acid transport protein
MAAAAWGGLPLTLLANGMRLASQDGFATARGEAFAATADNASAIYYNPAGITQLEGDNLRLGIYGIYIDANYRPPNGAPNSGNTYHDQEERAAVPQLFYARTPGNGPLSYGLGIYAPYGLSVSWPQDTGFRSVALKSALTYITFNPAIALKLGPTLSIGGGVMVNYGDLLLEQGLLRNYLPPYTNYFRFKGTGWSVGYNLGLLWQVHEQVSVGAAFRSAANMHLEGRTEFEQEFVIQPTHRSADADFKFPLSAVFGISYRPTPAWNLEFNADYTDWSSFDTVTIHQAPPPWPVQQDIAVNLKWQPSWMYEFGVTRYFGTGWHVSAGYVYSRSAVPDTYYTPLAADMDRHFFSVGGGVRGKLLEFDLAYQFGYGPARTVTGSTPSSTPGQFAGQTADGTYDFLSHALLITVGMHF